MHPASRNTFVGFLTTLFVPAVLVSAQQRPMPRPTPTLPAQPVQIDLVSIAPTANRVMARPKEFPERLAVFVLQGTKGTAYSAVFSAPQEPSVVIGIGANISSTAFDATTQQETISFTFSDSIVTTDTPAFPANHFILIIDPGVDRVFNPQPRPEDGFRPPRLRALADTVSCLGPGNRSGSATVQTETGPPAEAAGSYMSTNLFDWCVIPPTEATPQFGFRLGAPSGKRGYFKKKLSKGLVDLLSRLAGKTLQPSNLAIFNNGFEASKSITATDDGGAIININVTFKSTLTTVANSSRAALGAESARVVTSADDSTSVEKTITTSEAEPLSLTPKNTQITRTKTALYGFVDDISAIAGVGSRATSTVTIQKKSGSTFKTIGTATLNSDGSYSANIKTSTVFGNKSRATLVSRIDAAETRTSREVSLTNLTNSSKK